MKVVHVVPHVGNEASGPTYSTVRLSQSLAEIGNSITLMSVKDGQVPDSPKFEHRIYPKKAFISSLWRSPSLYQALLEEAKTADIIHSSGLWVMPNVYPGWVSKECSVPLVLSPRGTLSRHALTISPIRKKIFWALLQGKAVKQAVCLHATSEQEHQDIRNAGFKQPICIVPNGIDIPQAGSVGVVDSYGKGLKTLLYLGRIHPIKGIDLLIQAWSEVALKHADWKLRIAGPGDKQYVEKLKKMVGELNARRVEFPGPVYGDHKQREYRDADIYILPSRSENFGVTVAEALAAGTPVVASRNAPWAGLVEHNCGWWTELNERKLTETLLDAMSTDTKALGEMGEAGRRWVSSAYNWTRIASQMSDVYSWLLSGGTAPDCVRVG